MTETKRWVIALIVSISMAVGANYWMTTVNQATMAQQIININSTLESHAKDISAIEAVADKHTFMINNNTTANVRVSEVAVTLVSTTKSLNASVTALTDVVIRLEERDKIKNGR